MRDLVLIPSYYRPEFLYLCLEHISKANGGVGKEIWIAQDRHHIDQPYCVRLMEQVRYATEEFQKTFPHLRYIVRSSHNYVGNVFNFLELYREAWNHPEFRYVYLIEDDVMVGEDFFDWHEAVQARDDYFCSVGWHCIRNPKVLPSRDPNAYIESARDFSSIGVCWKRSKLSRLAIHARPEYYASHQKYFMAQFPQCLIPPMKWTEQAGLVMRILLEMKGREFVAWPAIRRCAHVGISGYHRRNGYQFGGHLEHKVELLRSVVSQTDAMLALSPEKYDDIQALPVAGEWSEKSLYVSQRIGFDGTYE